jgi:Domain of unknown function (DUF4365)
MPLVKENRLKGNYGTALVMSRLSSECLVRPVAADTDVGVDLYCETVADSSPFLHFWLQVKAGDQCKVDAEADRASCSFEIEHLNYWARQPVPVFAALVPVEWPVRREPDVYIVDITTQCILSSLSSTQKSLTLTSNYRWPVGQRAGVQEFLMQVVPDTTARLQVSKGVIAHSPTPTPEYVQNSPSVPVLKFKDQIQHQLRRTAANAILFLIHEGCATRESDEFRRLLASIVEQFGDDPHWENFFSRGISFHADEDYSHAIAMYAKARQSIENDPNVRDHPSWRERVKQIERLEEQARSGDGLILQPASDYAGS